MLINGRHCKSIERIKKEDNSSVSVRIIDQRCLPFFLEFETLRSSDAVIKAIAEMHLRGAPLIGAVASYGVVFACREALEGRGELHIEQQCKRIIAARPTAVNAEYCVGYILDLIKNSPTLAEKYATALQAADELVLKEELISINIGKYGLEIIKELSRNKNGDTVNILTHCNAGWLACIDYGTATAPIYMAAEEGIKIHVWVDETRPRNQGARLTAWELSQNGIEHTLITDNTGGYLMQEGLVDMVIVGSDRTTLNGDTANKIGTYLKALAAKDNNIPFWVAVPSTSIDREDIGNMKAIPIERREDEEVSFVEGLLDNNIRSVRITAEDTACFNPGFDVTPARLITGLITERGLCKPNKKSILELFPEMKGRSMKNEE